MKLIKLLPILIIIFLQACRVDAPHSKYTNVVIPVAERSVPENGLINIPLTIFARATADNGCWSNINFRLEERSDREYDLFALADFETFGECPAIVVSGDTTLTITFTEPHNYIIRVWMSSTKYELDTIKVKETLQER